MQPYADVTTQYAEFAEHCVGSSACFEAWSRGVAEDPEVTAWVATLPGLKKQPNIVFGAARWHGVPAPGPYAGLRDALLGDDGTIRATILARATQTNEVGRLATLLPAFAVAVPGGPIALIEVGASAGLNLFPDRWGYQWQTPDGVVTLGAEPRLVCAVTGPAPLPSTLPDIAWRAGIDLNPLDVADEDAMAWLGNLIWPEHDDRRDRLARAIEVARTDPPRIVRGDLLEELPALVAEASAYGTVLVFHSAVIAYLDESPRRQFHAMATGLVSDGACHWVSNESPRVLPEVVGDGPAPPFGQFVQGVDGHGLAWADGHGRSLHWLGSG